ncbi:MAG TPA: polyphosphate kinase 1 [Pyrinomonadaceae bacterium]|nr:polyphosphate kinase 1 [Pyrinomonadaceae bacterium]
MTNTDTEKGASQGEKGGKGTAPKTIKPGEPASLINRELSLIEFFRRVLEEAEDETQPLLERLKFLSIFSSNLDEFFMIRVSGLKETFEEGVRATSPDGMTPEEQLKEIRSRLIPMIKAQSRCLQAEVLPRLKDEGIEIAPFGTLSETEQESLEAYFMRRIFPVLTPQAVDLGHPFPYISGASLNIGLMVGPVREHGITQSLTGSPEPRFARIEVPPLVPRLIPVGENGTRFVLVEELIAANIAALFPRMHPSRCYTFRVTRDADVEVREDEAVDLLHVMEQTLRKRRFGSPVRLEVTREMPDEMVGYLTGEVEVGDEDVYRIDGPLDMTGLMALYDLEKPELKDRPFEPSVPPVMKKKESIFDMIKRQDLLLHHPYNSFSVVTNFIESAAQDPDVVAIKICLYRTGKNSPIPQSLIEASKSGKQVTVLIELKARFDEENNIEWAKQLEEFGIHVIYGLIGVKTHCKLALVIRNEGENLRQYMHIATGNYNPVTSRFYTDLSFFTADEWIGADAIDLFNFLTGFSRQKEYNKLMVAPASLRQGILGLIRRETAHAREGRPARIIAKFNRLADTEVIRALYEASQAGVSIDLTVRGVCMLRPGLEGLSDNIRVRSVVGRFLEHSRIFYFMNGGEEEVYTGSADWMPRNFDRRVEVIAPVEDARLKARLKEILEIYLADNVKARRLLPDGSYERITPAPGEKRINSQTYFIGA